MRFVSAILIFLASFRLLAQEVMPPSPAVYFNDYAHVVSPGTAAQLNQTLEDFERQSSDQVLVAIYPTMQSDSDVADYTVRVARSWRAGLKAKNNGAILFVFVKDHKVFLQVGYGLEAVLPDALCKRIIDEQISPRFKAGDFDGGMSAGVQSIIAATKGEYKGNGSTVDDAKHRGGIGWLPIVIIIIFIIISLSSRRRGYGSGGMVFWGGGWGGGGSSGGGGGGGGGFSGGGGSFGGGGAGGSW